MNHVFFGIIWVLAQILRLLYRIEVKGLENLPRNGVLLCPNHASDLDPVLIGICLPINYRLHFMAKEELFQNRLFGRILRALGAFPVNREGADIQAVKTAMKVIHEGENLLIFPEGTTIHDGVGYHDGLPAHAHSGIAMIGVRSGATLVPVFADGKKRMFRKTTIIFGEPYVPQMISIFVIAVSFPRRVRTQLRPRRCTGSSCEEQPADARPDAACGCPPPGSERTSERGSPHGQRTRWSRSRSE